MCSDCSLASHIRVLSLTPSLRMLLSRQNRGEQRPPIIRTSHKTHYGLPIPTPQPFCRAGPPFYLSMQPPTTAPREAVVTVVSKLSMLAPCDVSAAAPRRIGGALATVQRSKRTGKRQQQPAAPTPNANGGPICNGLMDGQRKPEGNEFGVGPFVCS